MSPTGAIMWTVPEASDDMSDRAALYDAFDDEGRAWLDEIVCAFNRGGYTEAVEAFLVDEACAFGE